jgi:hypothetical protein
MTKPESFDVRAEYKTRLNAVLDALGDDDRNEHDPELSTVENYIRGNWAARYRGIEVFGALSGSLLSAVDVLKSASNVIEDPQERAPNACAQVIVLEIILLMHDVISELTGVAQLVRERAIDDKMADSVAN